MFGIITGTNSKAADIAVRMVQKNSILTNVAETSDGHPFWQGKEPPPAGTEVVDWRNQRWLPTSESTPAHDNARFTSFCKDCPAIHPDWDSPKGVPISAIIFGTRRFDGKCGSVQGAMTCSFRRTACLRVKFVEERRILCSHHED